jgi:cell division protein FtsN
MSISPFSARPAAPGGESRRARLVVVIATVGIAATLLAYAISPSVRHAVSHAAHSVKSTVSRVLDHDTSKPRPKAPVRAAHPARPARKGSSSTGAPATGGFTISSEQHTSAAP